MLLYISDTLYFWHILKTKYTGIDTGEGNESIEAVGDGTIFGEFINNNNTW